MCKRLWPVRVRHSKHPLLLLVWHRTENILFVGVCALFSPKTTGWGSEGVKSDKKRNSRGPWRTSFCLCSAFCLSTSSQTTGAETTQETCYCTHNNCYTHYLTLTGAETTQKTCYCIHNCYTHYLTLTGAETMQKTCYCTQNSTATPQYSTAITQYTVLNNSYTVLNNYYTFSTCLPHST